MVNEYNGPAVEDTYIPCENDDDYDDDNCDLK